MQSYWGTSTVGGSPIQLVAVTTKATKLMIQSAPGNTGNIKIGGAGLTSDNSTPGIFLAPSSVTNSDSSLSPGDSWAVESHDDVNTLNVHQYYVHGTHSGDLVMWVYHVN